MTCLSKRKFVLCMLTFCICLVLLVPQGFSLSLEETISRRKSSRSYTTDNIPSQWLLKILELAYGTTNGHRSMPPIGEDYSLVIFPYNETGSYRFIPENNSLVVHDPTVNKNTVPVYDYYDQAWVKDASFVLAIVWNQTKIANEYFVSAEAGCFVQNVYLGAISFDLGTICVGSVRSEELRTDLNLPSTLIPILVMPLGYPTTPYPQACPYEYTIDNLPPVQYSDSSFEDAVSNIHFAQEWSAEDLSLQEISQLLWAAYGYTNITAGWHKAYHKTTPDSYAWYPLIIYFSNATGVYRYLPDSHPNATPTPMPNHAVKKIVNGDKRSDIANAFSGQVWAADASTIFLIVYNSSYNGGNTGDGGTLSHEFTEVGAGCVIQELFLEASARDLSANVVGETWDGVGAEELRNILGLPPSAIPLYIVPVGVPVGAPPQDSTPPVIEDVYQQPANDSVHPDDEVMVYANVTDDQSGVKQVTLNYTNGNGTWITDDMTSLEGNVWNATIPPFPYCTNVTYIIIAEDNANNTITTEEMDYEYQYHVIPEFQSFLIIPLLIIATLLAAILLKRKKHLGDNLC